MYKPDFSSLNAYMAKACQDFANKPAFLIRRKVNLEKIYYRQIPGYLSKINQLLKINKIKDSDKILFWGMNCPEYSLSLLAVMTSGKTAVPIDWRNNQDTIEKIIDQTKPKLAFVSKYVNFSFLEKLGIKCIVLEDLFALIPAESQEFSDAKPSNLIEIVYTSGTTGTPKGVMISEKNILANLENVAPHLPDITNARLISILPLSHMLEQSVGLFLALGYGATIHYLPRINSFRLLQAFQEYHPTHLVVVPQLLKILWDKIEQEVEISNQEKKLQIALSLSKHLPIFVRRILFKNIHQKFGGSLKIIACGGAPLDPHIASKWLQIGLPIVEGYGATEITAIATVNNWRNPKFGSAGQVINNTHIHLDQDGQIIIQSSSVSTGYYQNPDKTKLVFTPDGYKTGDIGKIDKDGYLYIQGRDFFKLVLASGEKVYVEDLESKIKQNREVSDVCIVSKKINNSDTIHAFFILKNKSADLKHILKNINLNLESKQQIFSFELWKEEDFPRTPTLKINRQVMQKIANLEEVEMQTGVGNLTYNDILDIVSKVSGTQKDRILDTDTLAGDLSITSLSRVELVALAEEYLGLILDETKITAQTMVSDLKLMAQKSETVQEIYLPQWQFTKFGQIIHLLFIKLFLHPLHSIVVSIKSEDKIPRIKPGSIILFNHPGFFDGLCVTRILSQQGLNQIVTNSDATFWQKETLFSRFLETTIGGIPLFESGQRLIQVLKTDADLLDRGYSLLFAPQGTLQTSEVEPPFKMGIGFVIQMLNRPVYIVKIKNYRDIWPVPTGGFKASKIKDFFPKKTGSVTLHCSKEIAQDWASMPAIQITNLLEEKYRQL